MSVLLYLFDIDGTLLHAHGSGREAFDAVFVEQHGIANASEGIRYGGKTDPQIVGEIFAARIGRAPTRDELEAFLAAYIPRLRALLATNRVVVIEGVLDALRALSGREGVMVGLATGNIRRGAYEKLSAANLTSWFEPIETGVGGFGCDSAVRSELVAKAIERGRARGEIHEVIVVGDTIHDISAARACNAMVVAVATGSDPADKLGHADAVMSSLADLPAWHAQHFE